MPGKAKEALRLARDKRLRAEMKEIQGFWKGKGPVTYFPEAPTPRRHEPPHGGCDRAARDAGRQV